MQEIIKKHPQDGAQSICGLVYEVTTQAGTFTVIKVGSFRDLRLFWMQETDLVVCEWGPEDAADHGWGEPKELFKCPSAAFFAGQHDQIILDKTKALNLWDPSSLQAIKDWLQEKLKQL
ncbi:MAG: hypothetical protein H7A33_04575 [Deltaproteobacteria bacterium]|nr:hypothetical protein [Deltaproteobacteria bacterium]